MRNGISVHRFDEPLLVFRLSQLEARARVVFSLACAERLRPYFGYPEQPPLPPELRQALQGLGRILEAEVPEEVFEEVLAACDRMEIDDDMVSALAYACGAKGEDGAQSAAWAARCAYEARDRLVSEALDVDFNVSGSEALVLNHPVVQRELERQEADLDRLASSWDHAAFVIRAAQEAGRTRDIV